MKHRLPLSLLLALSLLSAACLKVGPDFKPPLVEVSPNWLEAKDPRVSNNLPNYRDWWRVFQDPALDRLIQTAYKENLPLRQAGVRVLEARAQMGIAVGQFYPQTQQVVGDLQKYRLSYKAPQAEFSNIFHFTQTQLGLAASWELDFWGKFRRGIESADASLLATVADYDSTLVSLTGDVAANYVMVRTLEKRLAIARQNVATQQESLKIAEVKFTGGTTTQRDVEQAKTILANTQATIPTLQTQLRQTKNALSVLLGLPPSHLQDFLGQTRGIPAPPPVVAVGIPADLMRRRPDVQSAELKAVAQGAQIGVAKAELFPAFSLTGNLGLLSSNVGNFSLANIWEYRSRTVTAGPTVQWNIFNYGRIMNNVRVQDARFQELLIAYQNTVLTAQQEVEDNLVAFLQSQERAARLGESVAAAQRSLDLAILQYREGTTDFTTVLTAQQALLNEQDSLAATLGDISRSLVGVYRALGGGWELREGQQFVPAATRQEMAQRTNWNGLLTLPPGPEPLKVSAPVPLPAW